jgi:four helix bundle protein
MTEERWPLTVVSYPLSGERERWRWQMRRAVVSVPANIAEGQARWHRKDFLRHLFIAHGSLAELDTLVLIAERLGIADPEWVTAVTEAIRDVRMPLAGLIAHLRGGT